MYTVYTHVQCTCTCRLNLFACIMFIFLSSLFHVCCSVLQVLSVDGKKKTFYYQISVPTPAPLIGFVAGVFEILPDPSVLEMTHFTLPGTTSLLKNTIQFVHEVIQSSTCGKFHVMKLHHVQLYFRNEVRSYYVVNAHLHVHTLLIFPKIFL